MDITLFIFLSMITFFMMFYGWSQNGVNFVFLLISSGMFAVLAFSSFDITWSYPMLSGNSTTTYTISHVSVDFVRLYGLLSGLCFFMALGKVAIIAEENFNIDFPGAFKRLGFGKGKE